MIISMDEFKADIEHYINLVGTEEIIITRDGRYIAQLLPPPIDKAAIIDSLCGILPSTVTVEEAREARLAKHTKHWDDCRDIP